jgi:hypothetical protein
MSSFFSKEYFAFNFRGFCNKKMKQLLVEEFIFSFETSDPDLHDLYDRTK